MDIVYKYNILNKYKWLEYNHLNIILESDIVFLCK